MSAASIPAEVAQEIFTSYAKIGSKTAVAVRSSATAEDLPEASFAGQQESYLNVIGDANVVAKLNNAGSLFGARSIFTEFSRNSITSKSVSPFRFKP